MGRCWLIEEDADYEGQDINIDPEKGPEICTHGFISGYPSNPFEPIRKIWAIGTKDQVMRGLRIPTWDELWQAVCECMQREGK